MRQLLILLIILLAGCTAVRSQDTYLTVDQLDRRSQKRYDEAKSAIRMQAYQAAIGFLSEILDKYPNAIDILLKRGDLLFDQRRAAAAEADYEAALALSQDYSILTFYKLARAETKQEKFAEAIDHYQAYLDKAPADDRRRDRVARYLEEAQFAAEIMRNRVDFTPTSLGDSINTPKQEFLPSFSADGQLLIYTVNYDGGEDFYFSRRREDGSWSKGQPLEEVNSEQDEGAQTSSADGKLLFFTGCYRKGGLGNCDLYYTSLKNGKWQDIKHPKEPLNSAQWDSQPSLSANGGLLYFASKRPGGYGGRDIYYSYRQADGNWGKPINAGPVINTAGDEQSPFLHADGQTLYFMSDGHPGLGDADLFISRIGREGTWLKPVNLGSPINTSREEGGLVVSLDGKMAYYTTDQNTKEGGQLNFDIYQFPLYEGARPQAVTYVQGTVTDAKNKRKLAGATVRILVEEENRILAQPMTDTEGQFLVVLPAGRNYQLQVDKVDYLFYSDRFALADASSLEEPFELTVALARVPSVANPTAADPIVLRNVQFASGEAELLAASNQELLRLTQLLQTYPDLRIEITGHTDNVGQPSDNLRLSEARAQAVYNYIVEAGIATDRLSYQGFGEEKPIADNDTEEGRARNRRTEFVVVE